MVGIPNNISEVLMSFITNSLGSSHNNAELKNNLSDC
jgi:hypothetical protein